MICLLFPITEAPGYAFSLFISLVLSSGAGQLSAAYPERVRKQVEPFPGARNTVLVMYFRSLRLNLLLLLPATGIVLLNGLRTPACNNLFGAAFFVLIPVLSVAVATSIGLFIGTLLKRALMAMLLFQVFWMTSVLLSALEMYWTPAMFCYGLFFGFLPGTLYDTAIDIPLTLLTFRGYTILVIVGCLLLMDMWLSPESMRLLVTRNRLTLNRVLATGVVLVGIIGFKAGAVPLGHASSRENVEKILSLSTYQHPLEIRFDPRMAPERRRILDEDIRFSLHRIEQQIEIKVENPLRVYVFRDADQRRQAIGTRMSLAKPWRREAYVVAAGVPDYTIRHELAHLVAGEFGSGIFRMSGKRYGILPVPGLIEGVATALEGPRESLGLHRNARAMRELDILPTVRSLFSLRFLGLHAGSAYIAAGSFCDHILQTYGASALRRVYAGEPVSEVTGKKILDLETEWHLFLDTIPITPHELQFASFRFDRPPIVQSRCVHEVSRLREKATRILGDGDCDGALTLLQRAHLRSGMSTDTSMQVLQSAAFCRQSDLVQTLHEKLQPQIAGAQRSRLAHEILLDTNLQDGIPPLSSQYSELYRTAVSDADQRRLYLKKTFLKQADTHFTQAAAALTVFRPRFRHNDALNLLRISRLYEQHPKDPLAAYLLASLYFRNGDESAATSLLRIAIAAGIENHAEEIRVDALQLLGESLYRQGIYDQAMSVFTRLRDSALLSGHRAQAMDWLHRIEWKQHQNMLLN